MNINKSLLPLVNPLSKDNPVIVQVLGICSALAVTAKLEPAVVMTISVTAVLALANVIISLLQHHPHLYPNHRAARGCGGSRCDCRPSSESMEL